jgi:SAM-dependent methyltransferase
MNRERSWRTKSVRCQRFRLAAYHVSHILYSALAVFLKQCFAVQYVLACNTLSGMTQNFYDQLAPYYHLLYPNWEASSARQSRGLAEVLDEFGVPAGSAVLDAACGIGTQALGLAQLGYHVTASDLSPAAVDRARVEARTRGLTMNFAVADLRQLSSVIDGQFRAVVACDNAIPHLLSDAEIAAAFAECRRLLDPGGVLLISVRDYASIERRTPDHHPYGSQTVGDSTYSAEQVWRWEADQYDVTLRITEQHAAEPPTVHEFHSRYYAVGIPILERLLREAGFGMLARRDEHFFQPLLVAVNSPER